MLEVVMVEPPNPFQNGELDIHRSGYEKIGSVLLDGCDELAGPAVLH